jgi:hypothetical protein
MLQLHRRKLLLIELPPKPKMPLPGPQRLQLLLKPELLLLELNLLQLPRQKLLPPPKRGPPLLQESMLRLLPKPWQPPCQRPNLLLPQWPRRMPLPELKLRLLPGREPPLLL